MVARDALGEVDARILEILQSDAKRPYADLGADLGMSGPAAHERVKKLEARGIIRGYEARIDPSAAGFDILAFTWVTAAPGSASTDLTAAFAAIPEIEECHHIAGEADYLLKIRARDTRDLERVIDEIQTTRHVFTTESDVVLSTSFERRPVPFRRNGAVASTARTTPETDHDGQA
jgi:Lrp/AsnC family transcriptional regulator, leucine-responsive regulatory protein